MKETSVREYNPNEIEEKWQKLWEQKRVFATPDFPKGKKAYILDMFPYPSGSGLHVGHPLGYTATDILTRFKRMNGFSVLHPMGFDSFGLPAEQHAIATGEHPAVETNRNCEIFKKQMKRLGFAYDWGREIRTSDPSYYKWTQYIFTLFYSSYFDTVEQKAKPIEQLPIPEEILRKGPLAVQEYQDKFRLAYIDYSYVNFCPELGTVLANEEVIDGKSERGGFDVIRIPYKQWVLRITAYAERLLKDLKLLDWPKAIIEQQINWIGKSEGHRIKFYIEEFKDFVECFTTRLDTLPGVTFLCVAPEIAGLDPKWQTTPEVRRFLENALKKNERERAIEKSKEGVFTGLTAINPLTQKRIPVLIGEYVIASYGSGVIMGVPAHDERDFEFAKQNNIQIIPVVYPFSGATDKECFTQLGILKELKLGDTILKDIPSEDAKRVICDYLSKFGLCNESVSYKLRDWVFSRQRYWGEPIPIIYWEDGLRSVVPLEQLPLELPKVDDYKPSRDGASPLAKAKDWINVVDPQTGRKGIRETNTMPQWAGSCWYYLRYIDPRNDNEFVCKELEKRWMPVDLYVGGAEHAVLHLLYARFWHKFLFDLGYVSTPEPFKKLFNQGMILSYAYKGKRGNLVPVNQVEERGGKFFDLSTNEEVEQIIAKMSKSLRNVIDPLEIVSEYGA
ncbi:MAG: leucine--tRNA ligase, partial [Deltaproteobacteria bacterium]|nr:leucine--tRNA ligase [Deltaproteobacteria bacterium]